MNDEDGEGSSPRPRRKIKKVMLMSSSSDTDSDESVGQTRAMKKRLRVISDDEGSESSGSSVVVAGARRNRKLPKLQDSGAESDSSGWDSERSEPSIPSVHPNSGFASDSSEGNSDKCSICLLRFKDQEVGTPETCEHIFCMDCIMEWSKNVNTCPVDRKTFNSIVVRSCAGGRVLRTEPVHVVERRPSVDILVVEDPTVCEICGSADNEETMLLCDGCDFGYHMECLTPPLTEVPVDQWLCPSCSNNSLNDAIRSFQEYLGVADDLLGIINLPELQTAEVRATRRAARSREVIDEPSTSSGRRGRQSVAGDGTAASRAARSSRRRRTAARRTKRKRRSNAVLIEYEVGSGAKYPVTKTIKRRAKKRKIRRYRARTAARVSHVRGCVRARLAALAGAPAHAEPAASKLSVRRHRAGVPPLNLFGDSNQLHYFSDDEPDRVDSFGAAVAVRPPTSALSAYRQARRKMITIPSPPAASTASDLLSDILESQTLFYSKRSVVSIAVDGRLDIKLDKRENETSRSEVDVKRQGRLDLSKGEDAARKVPSYPGQQARGGGWGGGYGQRGTYREPAAGARPHRASYGPPGNTRGGHPPPLPPFRDDDSPHVFPRRPRRYSPERPRPPPARWPPLTRPPVPPDDALDMRTAGPPSTQPAHHSFRPLPEPPVFKFEAVPDLDKSEDERSDSGLVIDTEKYDPTEPTNDDDSGDDGVLAAPSPGPAAAAASAEASQLSDMRSALTGLDPTAINVPPNVLDSAVRQVLEEHRNLITAPPGRSREDRSDDDSEGDCPNFSIYSATSVHIASDAAALVDEPLPERPSNDLEDLVQEDDDATPPPPTPPAPTPPLENTSTPVRSHPSPTDNGYRRKSEEEYKERVSKRCPITTSTRNPIKIKLNAPSLIKRPISLYDEEDASIEAESTDVISEHVVEKVRDDLRRTESPKLASEGVAGAEAVTPDQNSPRDPIQNDGEKSPYDERVEDVSEPKNDKSDIELEKEENALTVAEVDVDSSKMDDDGEDKERKLEVLNDAVLTENEEKSEREEHSEEERENTPEHAEHERKCALLGDDRVDGDALEKMTESISETEDERSYTPCLDENKSKDTSFETDRDKGIEGLDTEMISEDEGDEMFSDEERVPSEKSRASPDRPPPATTADEADRKQEVAICDEDGKKKKKKESKKDKEKKNKNKKSDVTFKKPSKSGKERNYREREKDDKSKGKRERRESDGGGERDKQRQRRKEKRKDLERYDVRNVVSEKRKRLKDAFGRDVSPVARSPSPRRSLSRRRSPSLPRRSPSRGRRSSSPVRRRLRSPSPESSRGGSPVAPRRIRRSPVARSASPRRSPSPRARSPARKRRKSGSPRRRRSGSRARRRRRSATKSPRPKPTKKKKRSRSERPASRLRRRDSPRKRSPKRKKTKRRSVTRSPALSAAHVGGAWSPPSVDSRLLSPCTPPPDPSPEPPIELANDRRKRKERRRRDPDRPRRKRGKDSTGPSKEVFTSGDNILVSVSFKDQDRADDDAERRARLAAKRERRRRRRRGSPPRDPDAAPKPVAIIDLERSPFRELTPSPKNVIVLSDSDPGDKESAPAAPPPPEQTQEATFAAPAVGPKTPPEPAGTADASEGAGVAHENEERTAEGGGEVEVAPAPPLSPDAYDPFEPTRSASASPARAASPPRSMTLEAAQKTNMSADEVLDRRPLSPIEKVMALLQSTRDVSPEPPPAGAAAGAEPSVSPPPHAPAQRIVLPDPAGSKQTPKLFLAKPSPIKSNPVKPMQATKISKLPLPSARRLPPSGGSDVGGDSPYSPGSSDFVDLFEPPSSGKRDAFDALFGSKPTKSRKDKSSAAKVPVKLNRKKGNKTQVGVKIDEDNLKILDDLPSSAVEMQVKSKFLKKLNRQERVVEEVKLVLKPHYNKKHVTKDEYKDILRRAVPKICHNKSGEINPAKIQALVEAYVKKFRKKHKLGLV